MLNKKICPIQKVQSKTRGLCSSKACDVLEATSILPIQFKDESTLHISRHVNRHSDRILLEEKPNEEVTRQIKGEYVVGSNEVRLSHSLKINRHWGDVLRHFTKVFETSVDFSLDYEYCNLLRGESSPYFATNARNYQNGAFTGHGLFMDHRNF
ncbi:hypothetical protein AVEN_189345-1 [Araneus ventricosus]|uniref:Uncharacterized protein n=1 Tax=Araneus ventricosus TaxID=182803 RepID=A0A4Y2Q4W7_ARAVE|nr:hypothetical protein AVEN_189345-1 [Araneus ventricosus]